MDKEEIITRLLFLMSSARFERFYSDAGLFGRWTSGDLEYEEKITYEEATAKVKSELRMMLFPEK